jgi:hypothetical protein
MIEFKPGQPLLAQNALGSWLQKKAVSGVERGGHAFPVVWVCAPEDWQKPARERTTIPWPVRYVKPAPAK